MDEAPGLGSGVVIRGVQSVGSSSAFREIVARSVIRLVSDDSTRQSRPGDSEVSTNPADSHAGDRCIRERHQLDLPPRP